MDVNQFITVIGALTLINDVVVQFIKTKITDKNTTLIAFISAMALAFLGLYFDFYQFDIVATIILGLGVGLSGTLGYDKIKQCYDSIVGMKAE